MVEESASVLQRVEALEQISHARVVERVGQVEQRVSRIESAREAEEPHVATKADVARLETLIVDTRSELRGEIGDLRTEMRGGIGDLRAEMRGGIGDLRTEMQGEIGDLRTEMQGEIGNLKEQIGNVKLSLETKLRHLLMWVVGSAIALAAVIIAVTVFIVSHLA